MTRIAIARRCCRLLSSAAVLLAVPSHAAEPAPAFVGIHLTHMHYYAELGITETRVRDEMDNVIAEHGGHIDFAAVQDVAARITSIYRGAGFVFTRAYVPQQRSDNGWVDVSLLEGRLSSVDILDNKRYSAAVLTKPFADLLGRVIYSPDMEEAMAFLNDYPGLNAFGFYSVGEEPGSTRLNVRVQRERDWTGSLHADNYGSDLTGRVRMLAEAEKFNPTDNADHVRISALQTLDPGNATYGLIDYTIPVFDQRSQLALRASSDSYVITRGGSANQQIELNGKAHAAQIEYKRELKRGNANRSWHIGVSRDISTSAIKNIDDIDLDQKNWEYYGGFDFDHLDRNRSHWYGGSVDVVFGRYDFIDVPGQSRDYRYAHGFAAYSQGIALGDATHQLKFNVDWQYTRDLLPAISQYVLTGPTRLRGFLPGDFSADRGAIGSVTWVFPKWAFLDDKKGDDKKGDEKGAAQPDMTLSLFTEYGYGVQNVPAANVGDDWGYMSDVGAAWLFTLGPDLSATLTVATPLSHRINYQDNHVAATHVWLELLWRFH